MDDKKTVNKGGGLLSIMVTCLLCSVGFNVWAIEPSGQQMQQPAGTEESDPDRKPDIAEIERAIAELAAPVDAEKMSLIQQAIVKQRPEERKRLNKVLDTRMAGLYELPAESSSASSADEPNDISPAQEGPSPEDIRMQIDGLNLGQNATVEDLIMRDKLIAEIAGIQDPIIQYELIEYLQAKENNP